MPQQPPRICHQIDGFIRRVGRVTSWLNIILVLVILLQVVLRYIFKNGLVYLEEMQWHLYAVMLMLALSYGLVEDSHIRLDVLHRKFSRSTKEWVELLGILFLLMPLIVVLFVHGLDFVGTSWRVSERSDSPLGLPYRWIIKSVIPLSMALLGAAAVSRVIRALSVLFAKKSARGA